MNYTSENHMIVFVRSLQYIACLHLGVVVQLIEFVFEYLCHRKSVYTETMVHSLTNGNLL